MKALVIAPQPFFSPRGTPLSVYYRTLVTAELGVFVDLLTYGEGQDVDIPGVRILRIPRFPFLGQIRVGPSFPKLFLDIVLILRTIGLLIRNRYDFVHAHEEAVFFCLYLKPIFGFKLVYDMHSSLPQQLTNFRFTRSRFLIRIFSYLEKKSLRAADRVITICPDLAKYALTRIESRKHFLIENSLLDDVKLASRSSRSGNHGSAHGASPLPPDLQDRKPLVVYAGTLEAYQGIDLLIRAFGEARPHCPEASLVIVGGTPEQVARYERLAKDLGLADRCYFAGCLPQRTTRDVVRRASVLVSPRIEGTNTPLKIYEQLASGIPLVATDIYAHRQVLDETVCFLAAPCHQAFGQALVKALTPNRERAAKVQAARRLYEEKYAREVYVAKMRTLIEGIK